MDEDAISLEESKLTIGASFTISPHIYERLDRHILILKKLIDRSTTKQRWITNAIKEKILKEANNQQLPKATTLNIKIAKELEDELQRKVEFIRKFRASYSKKQWLVDAILEKLDRDEKGVEAKLVEETRSEVDSYKNQNEQLRAEVEKLKAQLKKAQKSN